jgi:hypothetical protein
MLVLTVTHTSFAQRVEPMAASSRALSTEGPFRQSEASQTPNRSANASGGVAGGIVGGGAGLLGGVWAGVTLANYKRCSGEDCGLEHAIIGAVVGEAVGLAVGAHYGARGRGHLAVQLLTSTAISVAGIYAAVSAERSAPVILAAVPVVQLAALLAMER